MLCQDLGKTLAYLNFAAHPRISASWFSSSMMDNGEDWQGESNKEIVAVYSDFMMRITEFEELVSAGSRFLVSFQQALGFLKRSPVDTKSTLVERIIEAHETKRLLSYIEAGYAKNHDRMQNVSKLRTCHLGLREFVDKAKVIIDEVEYLLGIAASLSQTSTPKDGDINCNLDSCSTSIDQEESPSPAVSRAEYASTMAVVYNMVKEDYTMQVRVVSSLKPNSSQEQLETYCQMWSLRPFVDDDIMLKAWNLVPKR